MPKFSGRFSVDLKGAPASSHNNFYLQELYKAAHGMGIVEFLSDPDGVYGGPNSQLSGYFYPVLPVAPLLDILKPESLRQDEDKIALIGAHAGSQASVPATHKSEVPLQKDGSYLIKMQGLQAYSRASCPRYKRSRWAIWKVCR